MIRWAPLILALPAAALVYAALLGLGMHRHAPAWAISMAATLWMFGPPLAVAGANKRDRPKRMATSMVVWALVLWTTLPVFFPGERRDATATGLSLLGISDFARTVANGLPDEAIVSQPELTEAALATPVERPAPSPLSDAEIALPYEGAGRRLAVPVVFQHGDNTLEVYMMLDTGATYTTLPSSIIKELGITHQGPVIRLHTANGERDAQMSLVDRVWLGDLAIDGVAIATCDPCASKDTVGLLGLNVAGGFNLNIDADRQEVIFTTRASRERHLDVKQFTDLDATFTRYPGGRVEVEVTLENMSPRDVIAATAAIHCGDSTWNIPIDGVPAGTVGHSSRRLPEHDKCDHYEIALNSATW
ncbi:MAG: hypothetical protein GWP91_23195 [Rhodobacterales bacterium]|nr:hypothetical protein [Rhodobacterales bacterium]